jgi:hypothetical protein
MPDYAEKVWELFGIPVPDILIAGWKKAEAIEKLLEESRAAPKQEMEIGLAEHTMKSEFHPYIEVRIGKLPPKKTEFTVELSFKLKTFVLKVQKGSIKELQAGECEVEGAIKYEDLTIAERKLEPIQLPGRTPIKDQSTALDA